MYVSCLCLVAREAHAPTAVSILHVRVAWQTLDVAGVEMISTLALEGISLYKQF